MGKIATHKDLRVFQNSFKVSMDIYILTKSFLKEEIYSLTDQIRRSSRSVCSNLAEAYRKEGITKLLFQNFLIVKVKLLKVKFG